jgi:phosphoribosylaminoimidazole-succinocarboxamide synthase
MTVKFPSRILHEKTPSRRRIVYEGTTKSLMEGTDDYTYVLHFKDDNALNQPGTDPLPALNGKGVINNRLSELLFDRLSYINMDHHFVRRLNMREQVVRMAESLQFYVDVHNCACDDFVTRFGYPNNAQLPSMVTELRFKNKQAGDPVIAPQHLMAFGLSDEEEIEELFHNVQRINDFLIGQFSAHGMILLRCRLEFGRVYHSENPLDTQLILIDEISLDTCRLLDTKTNQRLDGFQTETDDDETEEADMQARIVSLFSTKPTVSEAETKTKKEPIVQLGIDGYNEVARRFGIIIDPPTDEDETNETPTDDTAPKDTI